MKNTFIASSSTSIVFVREGLVLLGKMTSSPVNVLVHVFAHCLDVRKLIKFADIRTYEDIIQNNADIKSIVIYISTLFYI